MGESQISMEVIKNIFTEMFREQYEWQESLFKSHEETILSVISSNIKITTQQLNKFNKKRKENANRIERREIQNNDFSESFNTCQSIQDEQVEQVKTVEKRIAKLPEQLKSVNKDIECKHKEWQNLMRIQERQSRRNNIRSDGIAESPKVNQKDAENKLHQMLYEGNYFEKWDKSKEEPSTIVAKLFNYKDKEYILKNTHHLKDTNIYIYEDYSKEILAIGKSLWDEVKKLRQQGKCAIVKESMLLINMTRFIPVNSVYGDKIFSLIFTLRSLKSEYGS